ncbi:MAG: hypothetical protein HYZ28_04720 [Myxococcales bacterium]|nr:hypothetical protein [Myxococcales bacterium]
MKLSKPGWLSALLEEAVGAHIPQGASAALEGAKALPMGRGRARRYLRGFLRESGLLFGTPAQRGTQATRAAEEVLFIAVLRIFARIALDIAVLADAPPGPRNEQVLLLLAASAGQLPQAEEIHRRIVRMGPQWPLPAKLWRKVESELEERAMSLSGDPYYGLLLHNGSLYADAQLFGRLAIDYFARAHFSAEAAGRRLRFAAQQKALLVEVLTALACSERRPSFPARRAILRQVEDLRLPKEMASELRRRVKRCFERRPALAALVKGVRSADLRRFILEQTLLASLVEGRRSPGELAFVSELSARLGFSSEEVASIQVGVAEFYAKNREVVDVFTVSPGAQLLGQEMVDSMQRTLEKNFHRLLTEVKRTGELSVLLSRAARGQKLSGEERRRMREQLIDVAKAVPALAIFAAPGGILLLIALAKVLPFNLLPSAFHEEPQKGEERRDA